jgi:hypothetical protein
MRFWITSVVVLFGMVELYQSMKNFTLPLPVFILGGAVLAIASNYNKLYSWYFRDSRTEPPLLDAANSPSWNNLSQSQSKPAFQPPRPISFTINRSGKPE